MSGSQRRMIIILIFAVIIFGFSLYEFMGKKVETETPPPALAADSSAENTPADLVVYVSGAVNKPGVFKTAPKSRVLDAVNTAGGFSARADEEKINLAELLKDGQHINVPSKSKPDDSLPAQKNASSSNLININTADEKELQELPGIGPAMSKRIVEYRKNSGSFKEISELRNVSGIGEKRFKDLEDKVTL